jgi:hypothetical protein
MNDRRCIRVLVFSALCVTLASAAGVRSEALTDSREDADILAVGDWGDSFDGNGVPLKSTIKFFDARSGKLKYQLPDVAGGLHGPNGMLIDEGRLIVANQNAGLPVNGEVIQFGVGIKPGTPLVSQSDPHAPLAPHGILLIRQRDGSRMLFVADVGDQANNGKLLVFAVKNGHTTFVRDMNPGASVIGAEFRPRGLVLGPDGYLWTSLAYLSTQCGGIIARFDPVRLAYTDTVLSNPSDCSKDQNHLHRPEGLAFAPNGDLFIASFQRYKDVSDIDRILILRARERVERRVPKQLDFIALDVSNQPRSSTQALVFGPGGYLYVASLQTGEVLKYDVVTQGHWTLVSGGKLDAPFFLSFFKTNPATLAYERSNGHR